MSSFETIETILKKQVLELIERNGVLIPLIATSTLILLSLFILLSVIFQEEKKEEKKQITPINLKIKKDQPKVVDSVNCGEIENLAQFKDGKLVMCRCWKSSTFPYCDGSHVAHNKETGDNVGPLLIKK
eukprot:gene29484-38587_t